MSGVRRKILLVQDGSELVRQQHADSAEYFRGLTGRGYLASRNLDVEVMMDAGVDATLAGISPNEYACVVFTSNALIRPDGPIAEAFNHRAEDLRHFVSSGGGLVIFHQSFASDEVELPDVAGFGSIRTLSRESFEGPQSARLVSPGSPLAHFPNAIDGRDLAESPNGQWVDAFPLSYRVLTPASTSDFERVLTIGDAGDVLLTAESGGRVVVSAIPCDWARFDALVENILAFAIDRLPQVVTLTSDESSPNAVRTKLGVARLGGEVPLVRMVWTGEDEFSLNEKYLLSNASLCISTTATDPDVLVTSPQLRHFVEAGGTLAHVQELDAPYQKVTLYLGSRFGHELAEDVMDDVTRLNLPMWTARALVFDIRDVWLATVAASEFIGEDGPLSSRCVQALENRCRSWLGVEGQFAVDVGTGVLVVWLLHRFASNGLTNSEQGLIADLSELPLESELLVRSIRDPHSTWSWLVEQPLECLTPAGVVRLLDAVRCVMSMENGPVPTPRQASIVAAALGDVLDASDWSEGAGWISVDATASVLAGLTLLVTRTRHRDAGVRSLASGARCLVRARKRLSDVDPNTSLTALRAGGALVQLEAAFPVGAHQAMLRLVGSPAESRHSQPQAQVLRSSLSASNEALARARDDLRAMEREKAVNWADIRAHDRVAAALGRAMWAVVFLAVLVVPSTALGYYLTSLTNDRIEASAATHLGLLAGFVPVVGATWYLGERYRLLPWSKADLTRE